MQIQIQAQAQAPEATKSQGQSQAESGMLPGLETRRRAGASVAKVLSRVVVGDPGKRVVPE